MTIQEKIDRFEAHVRSIYEEGGFVFPNEKTTSADLDAIERILSLILPQDFRNIAPSFRGYDFSLMPQLPIKPDLDEENVVSETLAFRKDYVCPLNFIVLAAYDETLVLMKTSKQRDLSAPIYITDRCAPSEIPDDTYPSDTDDVFDSYLDYFTYCIDREVVDLGEG